MLSNRTTHVDKLPIIKCLKEIKLDEQTKKVILEYFKGNRANNGANLEPIKNIENLYSMRVHKKYRILYAFDFSTDPKEIVILDYMINHKYEEAKKKHKDIASALKYETNIFASGPHSIPLSENSNEPLPCKSQQQLADTRQIKYLGKTIYLNQAQEASLNSTTPLILLGPPGSGKTISILAILEANSKKYNKLLYVTKSPELVSVVKEGASSRPKNIDILSYNELLDLKDKTIEPDGLNVFAKWYDDFRRNNHKNSYWRALLKKSNHSIRTIYEAFRIISAFESVEAYKKLGLKNTIFKDNETKEILFNLYSKHWLPMLSRQDFVIPDFYDLNSSDKNEPKRFDLIVVDEAQDLSHLQLKCIASFAKNNNIVYCIDNKQNLSDKTQKIIYLKDLFFNLSIPVNIIQLKKHYRCPENIMTFAKKFDDMRLGLVEKNKAEARIQTSQEKGGNLFWINPEEKNHIEQLAEVVEQYKNDDNACIVTSNYYKNEAQHLLKGIVQIYTPQEVKGLEYKTVILYKIMDSDGIYTANQMIHDNLMISRHDTNLDSCLTELAGCFVAATRAINNIIFIQAFHRKLCLLQKTYFNESDALGSWNLKKVGVKHESTVEAWQQRHHVLFMHGKHDQANEIEKKLNEETLSNNNNPCHPSSEQHNMQGAIETSPKVHKNKPKFKSKNKKNNKKRKNKKKNRATKRRNNALASSRPEHYKNRNIEISERVLLLKYKTILNDILSNKWKKALKDVKKYIKHLKYYSTSECNYISILISVVCNNRVDIKQKDEMLPILLNEAIKDNSFYTYINESAYDSIAYGYSKYLGMLLRHGVDPNFCYEPEQATLLRVACENGHPVCVKQLLQSGADVDLCLSDGITPLFSATMLNQQACVAILLEHGANINHVDSKSCNVLKYAIDRKSLSLVKMLVDHGADMSQVKKNTSALMQASWAGNFPLVRYFLEKGLNINTTTEFGFTALDYAVESGSAEIVDYLLENDISIFNDPFGRVNALKVCIDNDQFDCFQLILNKCKAFGKYRNQIEDALQFAVHSGANNYITTLFEFLQNLEEPQNSLRLKPRMYN